MMTGNQSLERAPRLLLLPPPILYGICFAAGVLLNKALPWPQGVLQRAPLRRGAWILLLAAAAIGLVSLGCLLWQRTTVIPHRRPARLVTVGPFALSRNPMYLALTLAYCAGALIIAQLWPLLLLILPLTVIHRIVIPFEERRMRALFGSSYQRYCERVRRWL